MVLSPIEVNNLKKKKKRGKKNYQTLDIVLIMSIHSVLKYVVLIVKY